VQLFVGRGAAVRVTMTFERKLYVIRKRIEQPSSGSTRRTASHLPAEPLVEHVHLQGHALGGPDRRDVPDLAIPDVESALRSSTSGSAPTRSRRGRSRIRTASSRTTARSTRCAATSTG
jgi:hypothetical protein